MRHKHHQSQQVEYVESKYAPSDGFHVGEQGHIEEGHHHWEQAKEVADVYDPQEGVEVAHKDAHLAEVVIIRPEANHVGEQVGALLEIAKLFVHLVEHFGDDFACEVELKDKLAREQDRNATHQHDVQLCCQYLSVRMPTMKANMGGVQKAKQSKPYGDEE